MDWTDVLLGLAALAVAALLVLVFGLMKAAADHGADQEDGCRPAWLPDPEDSHGGST